MRRICLMLLLGLTLTSPLQAQGPEGSTAPRMRVYVGTYTGPKSRGIYLLEFEPATGKLIPKGVAAETPSPSFLAIHPNRKFLYAANEIGSFGGKKTGSVTSFSIDSKTGLLTQLNVQPSGGADPCYVQVDPSGKNLLVANYSGGSLEVLPIGLDGKLREPSSVIQHQGASADKARQGGPHAHSIDLDASGKLAVAADLGLDKLMIYWFDPEKGILTPNEITHVSVTPGFGPRHFAFHPDGKHAYAINEMASRVSVFDFDPTKGSLATTQTITTRVPRGNPVNSTAEILVHPSGKFVYGSNRGDDTLAIYKVEPVSGKLQMIGSVSTGGKTPRNFAIDPTGRFLIAANQDSNSLVLFKIDTATGGLRQVGEPVDVPSPVCVKFLPIEE